MVLTEKKAIAECKKLWYEIEASGLSKKDFLFNTAKGNRWLKKNKNYEANCPLCEYAERCNKCPLFIKYGKTCYELGFNEIHLPTKEWLKSVYDL